MLNITLPDNKKLKATGVDNVYNTRVLEITAGVGSTDSYAVVWTFTKTGRYRMQLAQGTHFVVDTGK